jgi:hypothetical protein
MKLHIRPIGWIYLFLCTVLLLASGNGVAAAARNLPSADDIGQSPATEYLPALLPPHDTGLIVTNPTARGGTVTKEGGFLFYSNNPEYVYYSDLADRGCWLNRAEVKGSGQVYTWHNNATGTEIKSYLSITNPHRTSIFIESSHYGLTNALHATDAKAWKNYFDSNQTAIKVEVKPGETVQLFKQSIDRYNNFGIVAALNITDINGNPATALLKDIAHNYPGNHTYKYARSDGTSRNRGVGSSYQTTITFKPVALTGNNYFTFSLGSANDSLNGEDLLEIKDGSNNNEGLLAGNYGQIMTINIAIKNAYKADQNFGIFIGSIGGYSYPFVRLEETSLVSFPVKPFRTYDMIQSGKIDLGSIKTVSFDLVIPALSSTPLIIGVHPID